MASETTKFIALDYRQFSVGFSVQNYCLVSVSCHIAWRGHRDTAIATVSALGS